MLPLPLPSPPLSLARFLALSEALLIYPTRTHNYNNEFSVPYDRDQFQTALRCALFLSYPNKITVRCQSITWGERERDSDTSSLTRSTIIDRASSLCARRAFNLIIDKFLVFLFCCGLLTFSQCAEKKGERERERNQERRGLITHSAKQTQTHTHTHVYVFETDTHTPK